MAYTNECLKHQQHQHHCFSLGEGGRVTSIMGVGSMEVVTVWGFSKCVIIQYGKLPIQSPTRRSCIGT